MKSNSEKQTHNSQLEEVIILTDGLDRPSNPIVKEFERKIFDKIISQENFKNIDSEELTKQTLQEIILERLMYAYGLNPKSDLTESDAKLILAELQPSNDLTVEESNPGELSENEQEVQEIESINTEGKEKKDEPEAEETTTQSMNEEQDLNQGKNLEALKVYINQLVEKTYLNQDGVEQPIWQHPNFISGNEINIRKAIDGLYEENSRLNERYSEGILEHINNHPAISVALQNLTTQNYKHLDQEQVSKLLTSKEDLRTFFDGEDEDFTELFEIFQESITEAYETDKSLSISYLYEQFVKHPDEKIQGITYIVNEQQSKVEDILSITEEAPDLGLSLGELKHLQQKSKEYPEALRNNFKDSSRSVFRNKDKMKALRSARLDLAKLRAYNAALDLNITNEELADSESGAINKIKEEVFTKAISSDLEDLFQNYQGDPTKNKMRKKFNKITQSFSTFMAGASAGLGLASQVAYRSAFRSTAAFALGPFGMIGAGALLMKPATRRLFNTARLIRKEDRLYDKVAINFSEASRDMTGNKNDSLFNEASDIENEYIRAQKESLQNLENDISEKVDTELSNDKSLKNKQRSLKLAVMQNKDPGTINKLALIYKKELTKKVTEFYVSEYKKVLTEIELKRSKYIQRVAAELAAGAVLSTIVSVSAGLALGNYTADSIGEQLSSYKNNILELVGDPVPDAEATESISPVGENNSPDSTSSNNKPEPKSGVQEKNTTSNSSTTTNDSSSNTNNQPEVQKQSLEDKLKSAKENYKKGLLENYTNSVEKGGYEMYVPTDTQLQGTTDKDPGLVQLIRAWTDNKISVKDALAAAKQIDLPDVNKISDGERLVLSKDLVDEIASKANIKPQELLKKDITDQFIKYNKAS